MPMFLHEPAAMIWFGDTPLSQAIVMDNFLTCVLPIASGSIELIALASQYKTGAAFRLSGEITPSPWSAELFSNQGWCFF